MGSVASCLAHQSILGGEPGTCWGELEEEAKLGEGLLVVEARDLLGEGKGMGHLIPVASQRREQNFFCYTGRSLNAASAEDLNRQKMKIYPNSKFIWQASCIFFFLYLMWKWKRNTGTAPRTGCLLCRGLYDSILLAS